MEILTYREDVDIVIIDGYEVHFKKGTVPLTDEEVLLECDKRMNPDKYKTDAEKANEFLSKEQSDFRTKRNMLLVEADITINKLEDNGQDSTAWRQYRQALRDSTITWTLPVKPTQG